MKHLIDNKKRIIILLFVVNSFSLVGAGRTNSSGISVDIRIKFPEEGVFATYNGGEVVRNHYDYRVVIEGSLVSAYYAEMLKMDYDLKDEMLSDHTVITIDFLDGDQILESIFINHLGLVEHDRKTIRPEPDFIESLRKMLPEGIYSEISFIFSFDLNNIRTFRSNEVLKELELERDWVND